MAGSVADAAPEPPCHPVVYQNIGKSILKDEDILLVEHQRPWPGCGPDAAAAAAAAAAAGEDLALGGSSSSGGGSARCSCCGAVTDEYSLFAVFDGHNGAAAATLVADNLVAYLEERLPAGPPPASTSPGFLPWREDIQLALVETLAELNKLFAAKGILAGCTATLCLQIGWLLTVANLGDSRAVLDTGVGEAVMLTVDHRVATHQGERRRVEAMGNTIAPIDFSGSGPALKVDNGVGPLRIWPGGLCLSRAIGDFDVGDSVIPFPHIKQVMVPPTGARLLVASDGVWDAYEKMTRIGGMLRSWSLDSAPQRLIQSIVRAYGGLRDDTSLVMVDILPPGKTFAEAIHAVSLRSKRSSSAASAAAHAAGDGSGGGGCGCFGSSVAPPPPPPPSPAMTSPLAAAAAVAERAAPPTSSAAAAVGHPEVLTDLDVAAVMGLMPGAQPAMPGWYDEFVGEHLFNLAAEAMECWQDANERRTGRRPPTPQLDSSVRAARAAKVALEGDAEPLVDTEGAAWSSSTSGGGGLRRAASVFFQGSVADGTGDYAEKFGHYKGYAPQESLTSNSPGSSLHGSGGGGLAGSPGSSMHSGGGGSALGGEGSVRSGGYRYTSGADASTRTGSRYFSDTSVRAGSRFLGDASVRAGSAYLGTATGNGGGGGSALRQEQAFRPDPSIRSGAAALRLMSDSAGSGAGGSSGGGGGMLAQAAAAPVAAAAQQHQPAAGGLASKSASAPIPVPRSVSFGDVQVLGGGGEGSADSAMEHSSSSSMLQQAGSGYMETIREG